ncbi:MAG: DUF4333 domain-containing protein [Cyanobacteria bacterium P01_A01_bin.37]
MSHRFSSPFESVHIHQWLNSFRRVMHRCSGAIFLAGLTLVAVGCAPRLDTDAIAHSIQNDLEEQGDIRVEKVVCPDNVEPILGQTFRCWGKLSEDEFFPIEMTQIADMEEADAAQAIDWSISTSRTMLNLAQLELEFQAALREEMATEIDQDLTVPVQVDCGATYRVNTPGETFTCQVQSAVIIDARRLENVKITVDSQGNLNWQGVRNLITPEELTAAKAEGLAFESIAPEVEDVSGIDDTQLRDKAQGKQQQAADLSEQKAI